MEGRGCLVASDQGIDPAGYPVLFIKSIRAYAGLLTFSHVPMEASTWGFVTLPLSNIPWYGDENAILLPIDTPNTRAKSNLVVAAPQLETPCNNDAYGLDCLGSSPPTCGRWRVTRDWPRDGLPR